MNKYLKLSLLFLGVVIGMWFVTLFAQDQQYTQADMDFILSQKIEKFRDIYQHVTLLDRQTQADTHTVAEGTTPDTICLDRKYKDTDYYVFITPQGNQQSFLFGGIPLTDSSFAITRNFSGASILVQWMTIHK